MFRKLSFKNRLLVYLFAALLAFTLLVLLFQYDREKKFKKTQLETTLDDITKLIQNYINKYQIGSRTPYTQIDSLLDIIPTQDIRITLIDASGEVLYDSKVSEVESMENHKNRPEVQRSVIDGTGSDVRESASTGMKYYYFARFYNDYFLRTAILYNIEVVNFLKGEKYFIVIILSLFLIIWFILAGITSRISKAIIRLRDFVIALNTGSNIIEPTSFPDDELGVISRQLVDIYQNLNNAKEDLALEKERLFSHLSALNEGVAFFTYDKKKILANTHFIQFLNIISEQPTISVDRIFDVHELLPVTQFIEEQLNDNTKISAENLPQMEHTISKGGKYFRIGCIIFQDLSFEILITDETRYEKRRLMKQQMTSNIAHELKTPVASIMGFLETLMDTNLESEKQNYFIEKTFSQATRLHDLIEDITVLNKIEETNQHFTFKPIAIKKLVSELYSNMKAQMKENKITFIMEISPNLVVNGNQSLLHSVFHNLIDNAIKYGGDGITISITNYMTDKNHAYFSFKNTGPSVPEEHLSRIFERFYRIDTGRSRKTGGTGLGLAIVKNTIQMHNGEISARNPDSGGVEFLFTLAL